MWGLEVSSTREWVLIGGWTEMEDSAKSLGVQNQVYRHEFTVVEVIRKELMR